MTFDDVFFVDADKLRIGLFVELDVGWMAHPFPTGSFKLVSVSIQCSVLKKNSVQ